MFSPRLRQHLAFNYNQLEIFFRLKKQQEIHSDPIDEKFYKVVSDSIFEEVYAHLLSDHKMGSQRLIYAYHEHLNLNYKSYLIFNEKPSLTLPDFGYKLNQSVLTKTHNFYEFGLGGIQLFAECSRKMDC